MKSSLRRAVRYHAPKVASQTPGDACNPSFDGNGLCAPWPRATLRREALSPSRHICSRRIVLASGAAQTAGALPDRLLQRRQHVRNEIPRDICRLAAVVTADAEMRHAGPKKSLSSSAVERQRSRATRTYDNDRPQSCNGSNYIQIRRAPLVMIGKRHQLTRFYKVRVKQASAIFAVCLVHDCL